MKILLTLAMSLACLFSSVCEGAGPIRFYATHLADWTRGHRWILPTPIRQGGETVAANYVRGVEILEVTVDGQRLEPEGPTHSELDKIDEIIECTDDYFLYSAGPSLLSTLSKDADGNSRVLLFDIVRIPDVIQIRYRKVGGTQEFVMESHIDHTVRFYHGPEADPSDENQKEGDR